jgi:hypothetical protein
MHLREALSQIAEIRQRMAESEIFRGYRALPVAISGLYAAIAGALQPLIVPEPTSDVRGFVLLWTAVAVLSIATAGLTMWMRDCFAGPSHTRAVTWIAIRQFVPGLFCGAVVASVVVRYAPETAWMLPGLWSLFYGQCIFASCRILPRPVYAVAAFFWLAGTIELYVAATERTLSPWSMALPFGLGQLFAASILYWTLERRDADETQP